MTRRQERLKAPRDRLRGNFVGHNVSRFWWCAGIVAHRLTCSGFELQDAFEDMKKGLQFLAQAGGGRAGLHPTPATNVVLQPVLEDFRDPHDVDVDVAPPPVADVSV